jgi:hypothetical protein
MGGRPITAYERPTEQIDDARAAPVAVVPNRAYSSYALDDRVVESQPPLVDERLRFS